MPDRNLEGNYRYKFQGQELDKETGKIAFELRLWDSRIGRWLTTDPAGQFFSPYLGMGNNPISNVDPDGGYSCPNPPCPEDQSGLGTETFNYLTGEYEFTGNTLDEVVITAQGNSSISKTNLILSSLSLSSAKTLDYLNNQTKGFSLKRDLFYNPFNSNRTMFSLPKEVTPKVKFTFRGLGYGLSAYSALSTESDYTDKEISQADRYYSHSLNAIGTALPGVGVGLGLGDYFGRKYHKEIAHEISTEGTVTVETVSNILRIMGLPPSQEIQHQWEANGKPSFFSRLFNNN